MYSDAKMEMFIVREMLLASIRQDSRPKSITDEAEFLWQPEMLDAIEQSDVMEYDKFCPTIGKAKSPNS